MTPDDDREFLRHVLAVIAYRGGRALRGAPPEFATFRVPGGGPTPAQILAHLGDLLDWAMTQLQGDPVWRAAGPTAWDRDVTRFFAGVQRLDVRLASVAPLGCDLRRLFQGPLADALTHVGQLSMLRRLAGSAVRGENFFVADIVAGRVGPDQAPPVREFD